MRKIASNLLLKEHAERVFFLCKQPEGYRIIKEIDGDYGQQILTLSKWIWNFTFGAWQSFRFH